MTIADLSLDVRYAFRTFRRAPLTAITVVATVALGLGLVAVVFTLFNTFVFRVDEVPNPGELYAVERPRSPNGDRVRLTRPDWEALRRETAVFSDSAAMLDDIDTRVDGRTMSATFVSGNFFPMVGVRAALGRALTPDDDDRAAPRPVLVLSHRGWAQLFASDPRVVGRSLVVNGAPFEIVGVMPEGFRGLAVSPPDYWAPFSLVGQFRSVHTGREDAVGIDIVGRLKPGTTPQSALAALAIWDGARTKDRTATDKRTLNLTIEPRQGTLPRPVEAIAVFTPILFAFGLILMIGCANVANLLLARGMSRQRELGIRLSLGASRWRVVRQLLTESLLLALASAALGFWISRAALQLTVFSVTSTIAPELADDIRIALPGPDWRVAVFLVFGALASTVFFGLMPALHATRLALVRAIRGEVTRDARPGRARNALVGLQVMASALLLIASAVFLRSALASATIDPGIRTSDTLLVQVTTESKRTATIDAVAAEPSVAAVSATWPDAMGRPRAALAETTTAKANVGYRMVSPEYFGVMEIAVLRGRGFTQAERASTAAVAVVSETVARQLWMNGDAVGQILRLEPEATADKEREDEPPLGARAFTVVGIARDVPGFRFADYKEANVYVPIDAAAAKTSLTVRVHGDPQQARQKLLTRLTAIDPNMGLVITFQTLARMETYFLKMAFWATLVVGALALVLTVSGLFSVLSYLVEQRSKEIGVRMALGATAQDVARMVVGQLVRPVAIGLTIGAVLSAALAIVLLSMPDAAQITAIVHVADPLAYLSSLGLIVAACVAAAVIPARRAAQIDPWKTLRQD